MNKILFYILLFITIVISQPSYAHTTSTSYLNLNLNNQTLSGEWQVTLNDINLVLGLDSNNDSKLVWSEIISQKNRIITEFKNTISIRNKDNCQITVKKIMVDRRVTNTYLNIPFDTNCSSNSLFNVTSDFLFSQDAFHKTILNITKDSKNSISILSYSNRKYSHAKSNASGFSRFIGFIIQGIIHVLIGLDHVLFVICLLISATLVSQNKSSIKYSFISLLSNTIKLVTAFTIAHSITLILASTKILSIPPTVIEPVIAFSVIVLALLNLYKGNNIKHWPIIFSFGLIHGFGFAFVLEEVSIQAETLTMGLFGFNLGVELGQLTIVLSVLPVLYFLNKKQYYQRIIIPLSSILIAFIGFIWLIERINIPFLM